VPITAYMISPFLYRARTYPLKLIVDIHTYCNARCTMCPYPKYSRQQSNGYMDWGLYCALVDELARIGRENQFRPALTYCYMAEPFLAEDLVRYVGFALARDIEVDLNTNGAVMTPEKINALLAAGFKGKIHVSFHGITPEVYQRIMGLDYQTAKKNLLYLLEHYDPQRIWIRGVNDRWPVGEKKRWFDFWQPYGAHLDYQSPISRCGSVRRLLPDNLQEKKTSRLYGCRYNLPLFEMVILFDGRAVMCCQDMGREIVWGDVSREGILGVWNGPVRQQAIQRLYTGRALPHSYLCGRCEHALNLAGLCHSVIQAAWRKIKRLTPRNQAAAI